MFALLRHDALGGGNLMKRLSDVGEEMMGGLFGRIASPTEAHLAAQSTPLHSSSCPSTPPTGSSQSMGSEANLNDLLPLLVRHQDHGNPTAHMSS